MQNRWGDPVAGFPRVGDEATEEHDKRWNGHEAHTRDISYNHKQASHGSSMGSSRYTFEACVSGRFEIVEEEGVHVRRGSSRSVGGSGSSCTRP